MAVEGLSAAEPNAAIGASAIKPLDAAIFVRQPRTTRLLLGAVVRTRQLTGKSLCAIRRDRPGSQHFVQGDA